MNAPALANVGARIAVRALDRLFPFPTGESSKRDSSLGNESGGKIMRDSTGIPGRNVLTRQRHTCSVREVKERSRDWIAEQARKRSSAEIISHTGLTKKAVNNLRNGRNAISFDTLTAWCLSDPAFAAEYAAHVGLILPGEAEYTGALNQTFAAWQRKQQRGAE